MTEKQAIKLSLELIDKELQAIAIDADLADMRGATYPAAINASNRRVQLLQAQDVLNNIITDGQQRQIPLFTEGI